MRGAEEKCLQLRDAGVAAVAACAGPLLDAVFRGAEAGLLGEGSEKWWVACREGGWMMERRGMSDSVCVRVGIKTDISRCCSEIFVQRSLFICLLFLINSMALRSPVNC